MKPFRNLMPYHYTVCMLIFHMPGLRNVDTKPSLFAKVTLPEVLVELQTPSLYDLGNRPQLKAFRETLLCGSILLCGPTPAIGIYLHKNLNQNMMIVKRY